MPLSDTPSDKTLDHNVRLNSRFVTVRGVPIYTRLVVDAPGRLAQPDARPLVLLHGLSMSSWYMEGLARRLAPDYVVFAPDMPGFGRSAKFPRALDIAEQATIMLAWLDDLGIERADFVGNSLGCQVIIEIARREPQRAGRLVLVSPTVDPAHHSMLQQIWRAAFDLTREPLGLMPVVAVSYAQAGFVRTWHTLRNLTRDPVQAKLPQIHEPTLVIRGANDPIVSQAWVEEMASLLPQGQVATVAGHAHAVHFAAPDEVAALVREFLG